MSVFQNRHQVQRAFRGRLAETGSSTWAEDVAGDPGVASEEAARGEVTTPHPWRGDRPHSLARRRGGGGKHRPRQARVKGIGALLVSEETGRAMITKTNAGLQNELS